MSIYASHICNYFSIIVCDLLNMRPVRAHRCVRVATQLSCCTELCSSSALIFGLRPARPFLFIPPFGRCCPSGKQRFALCWASPKRCATCYTSVRPKFFYLLVGCYAASYILPAYRPGRIAALRLQCFACLRNSCTMLRIAASCICSA